MCQVVVDVDRVLFVGELNPDIVVAGVVALGGKLRFGQAEDLVERTVVTLGGSAAITASAAARAGAAASLVAVVGDDDLGRACLARARERGIDVEAIRVERGHRTGSSVILISAENSNDRQILTDLGTMRDLSTHDLPDDLLSQVQHLHVSSFFMHVGCREQLHQRMARARELGAVVSLDTNDDPDRTWTAGAAAAIAASDVLFGNDIELLGLAGEPANGDPATAARALLTTMSSGASDRAVELPAVVRKQGAYGATVYTIDREVHVNAPQVEVVDTVGAGDTLAGTMIAAMHSGADWADVLAIGVAAGSLSTTAPGGVDGQPQLSDSTRLAATLRPQRQSHR
jgi:sugar/nucleoside kinase (ribokinase family)